MGTSGKASSVRRVDRLLPLVPFGLCYVLLIVWTLLTSTTPFEGESVRPLAWASWSLTAAAPFWWFLRRARRPTVYGEQVLLVIASLLFGAALVRLIDRSSSSTPIRSYVMILSEVRPTGFSLSARDDFPHHCHSCPTGAPWNGDTPTFQPALDQGAPGGLEGGRDGTVGSPVAGPVRIARTR